MQEKEISPFHFVLFSVRVANMAYYPLLRRNFGFRYFKTIETVAIFAPLAVGAVLCQNDHQLQPFILHFWVLLFVTAYHRVVSWCWRYGDNAPHSFSNGDPAFCRFGISPAWAIAFWEPAFILFWSFFWSFGFTQYSTYLFFSAVLLFGEAMFLIHLRDRFFFDLQDSLVDQETMADDLNSIDRRRPQ